MSGYLTRLLARDPSAVGALHPATRSRFGAPQPGPEWHARPELAAGRELENERDTSRFDPPRPEMAPNEDEPAPFPSRARAASDAGSARNAAATSDVAAVPVDPLGSAAGIDAQPAAGSWLEPSQAATQGPPPVIPAGDPPMPAALSGDPAVPSKAAASGADGAKPSRAEPSPPASPASTAQQRQAVDRLAAATPSPSDADDGRNVADAAPRSQGPLAASVATSASPRSAQPARSDERSSIAGQLAAEIGVGARRAGSIETREPPSRGDAARGGPPEATLSVLATRSDAAPAATMPMGAPVSATGRIEPASGRGHLPGAASASPRHSETPATVQVSIGTLEIRATVSGPAAPARPAARARPATRLTLDDYLRQRGSGTKP